VNIIDKNVELSVIMPVYNEAANIKEIILDYFETIVCKLNSDLIVAEDGSTDGTKEILFSLKNEIPISLFSDQKRKGYAKGVKDALRKCDGEWIFFSDSDGQYLSSDFWRLWSEREGHDMIIGRKLRRSEGLHRIVLSRGFHIIANNLFGLNLQDADCGFRLFRRSLANSMADEVKFLDYSYWAEFTIRASLMGFNVHEVPINHATRAQGKTQIYTPSKIPLIILKQLKGLTDLFFEMRRKSNINKN
jgi:dolichol-phosphate mannosyltransferase